MSKDLKVYYVTRFGEGVEPRPELGEELPQHADMLRYDLAFCHPENPSWVIFPVFAYPKTGRSMQQITAGRWQSFSMKLEEIKDNDERRTSLGFTDQFLTYRFADHTYRELVPVTLAEFKRTEGCKIVGWR